jgi:undecaprenyl-diphosphatase
MSESINTFDRVILEFLSRPALHSKALDLFAIRLCNNLLIKGGIMIAAMWWMWFAGASQRRASSGGEQLPLLDGDETRAARRMILLGFAGTVLALVIARTLEVVGRFRWRPLNYPDMFYVPFGMDVSGNSFFRNDNCFPSDHAALFFGLATILWCLRRRLGIIAYLHVAIIISLPRLYLMLHYPTDIMAGGLLGVVGVISACELGRRINFARWFADKLIDWSARSPASFYTCLFLWSFSVAEMFEGVRMLLYVRTIVTALLARH